MGHDSASQDAYTSASRDCTFADADEDGPFGLVPEDFLGHLFEVIPGRLSFAIHRNEDHTKKCIKEEPKLFFFSSWFQEAYDSFSSDFGPVNISLVARFCDYMRDRLADPRIARRHLVYYCDPNKNFVINSAFLLASYLVLMENWSPERAASRFATFCAPPFFAFRDATGHPPNFDLTILDCLRGLRRAVEAHIFDMASFDIDAYEALEDPLVADLHIICPKFVAMRGPTDRPQDGFAHTPAQVAPLLHKLGARAVIRLNEASTYDAAPFSNSGIAHHELEFTDCSAPSLSHVRQFLAICDGTKGRVAVHCKAGLGRTGTMIAVWLMREFAWTAREAIAWVRLVRPGSIMGPQQHFLEEVEKLLAERPLALAGDVASAQDGRWGCCAAPPNLSAVYLAAGPGVDVMDVADVMDEDLNIAPVEVR